MATNATSEAEVLYQHRDISVTRALLEYRNISYSIRAIRELETDQLDPPRVSAFGVATVGLLLAIWSVFNIIGNNGLPWVNWLLHVLSIGLMLVGFYLALFMKTRYWLDVRFSQGQKAVRIFCQYKNDLDELRDALGVAMESLHHEPDAPEPVQSW